MGDAAFQLVQVAYWLSLSTWFGAVLFIAVAAPTIFKTVTDHKPILPTVLSVNLDNQHATLLAGSIVGDLIERLSRVQLACAVALGLTLLAQGFMIDLTAGGDALRSNRGAFAVRVLLFMAAAATLAYDRRAVWPRVVAHRARFIEHADDPEIANPAKEAFDHDGRRTLNLLMAVIALLLGVIVFSGNITRKSGGTGAFEAVTAPAAE
jgi:hypothetical protein